MYFHSFPADKKGYDATLVNVDWLARDLSAFLAKRLPPLKMLYVFLLSIFTPYEGSIGYCIWLWIPIRVNVSESVLPNAWIEAEALHNIPHSDWWADRHGLFFVPINVLVNLLVLSRDIPRHIAVNFIPPNKECCNSLIDMIISCRRNLIYSYFLRPGWLGLKRLDDRPGWPAWNYGTAGSI